MDRIQQAQVDGTPSGLTNRTNSETKAEFEVEDKQSSDNQASNADDSRAASPNSDASNPTGAEATRAEDVYPQVIQPETLPEQPTQKKRIGRYKVVREIAKGTSGTLYEGWDTVENQSVALKIMHPWLVSSERAVTRMKREAAAAAKVLHPAVVRVHDFIAGETQPAVLVMELLSERTFDNVLADGNRDDAKLHLGLLVEATHGLSALHENGLIHRDIKPQNLLLDENADGTPRIVIGDLGLVRDEDAQGSLTGTEHLLGTPSYISPEQIQNPDQVDPRSDVYSLGCVMYKLLTGVLPYEGSVRMILWQAVNAEPRRPMLLNESIDPAAENICLKAIARRPQDRYQSAAEFADDLSRYLNGKAVRARQPNLWAKAIRWSEKRPATAVAIAAAVMVLLGTTIASIGVAGTLAAANRRETSAREASQRNALQAEKAAKRAAESQQIAEEQSRIALGTLVTVVESVTDQLQRQPGSSELRQRLLTIALNELRTNVSEILDNSQVELQSAIAFRKMGELIHASGAGEYVEANLRVGDWQDENWQDMASGGLTESSGPADRLAIRMLRRAREIALQLVALDPNDVPAQLELVEIEQALAKFEIEQGKVDDGIAMLNDLATRIAKFVDDDQLGLDFKHRLYNVHKSLDFAFAGQQDYEAAVQERLKACAIARSISHEFDWNASVQSTIANWLPMDVVKVIPSGRDWTAVRSLFFSHLRLGDLKEQLGDDAAALEAWQEASEIGESLCTPRDFVEHSTLVLVSVYRQRAYLARRLGTLEQARELLRDAIELLEQAHIDAPQDHRVLNQMTTLFYDLGYLELRFLNNAEAAAAAYRMAYGFAEKQCVLSPGNQLCKERLSQIGKELADIQAPLVEKSQTAQP
ncbi:MAG: hypothetical protein Aurels2KO_29670 [Aureliella sp.]